MGWGKHLKTQTALARMSGVAHSTIGRIVRGEVDPQSGNLHRLSSALGMPLSALARIAEGEEMQAWSAKGTVLVGGVAMYLTEEIDRALLQALASRDDRKRGEQVLESLRRKENESIERLQELALDQQTGAPINRWA
jgi:transcriptional regulator with XRE-family HTH domain